MGGRFLILLDTHTWIWWQNGSKSLSAHAEKTIKREVVSDIVGVSVLSCWEVAMLVGKGRLGLSMDVEEWIATSLAIPEVKLLELTPKISILSTRLSPPIHADPIDRMLVATSLVHACPIVTKDKLMRQYLGNQAIW